MQLRNKTRLAPTPSGYLHLGNILSFIVTEAIAGTHGAKVLLRIDDMDRERAEPRYITNIIETLHFLKLPYNEGPLDIADFELHFSQQLRLPIYKQYLQQLADNQMIFACTCSRADVLRASADGHYPGTCLHKQLPLDTPGAAWRLNTTRQLLLNVSTPAGIATHQLPNAMQYFVVRKKDGYPAYQLSSVADDLHYGIDLIVRGEDLWASTMAQLYLAQVLDLRAFEAVLFYHHPLLLNNNGQKLSKSAGDTSINWLRKHKISVPEIYNRIAQLTGHYDIYSKQQLGSRLVSQYWPQNMCGRR